MKVESEQYENLRCQGRQQEEELVWKHQRHFLLQYQWSISINDSNLSRQTIIFNHVLNVEIRYCHN